MTSIGDINKISQVNRLKKNAQNALEEKNFAEAISNYSLLLDSMQIQDDSIQLNLSNAYLLNQDTANAIASYQKIAGSHNDYIRSIANQQLGVVTAEQRKFDEALDYLKSSLKADPENTEARYDYEWVKNQKEQEEQQNQDQQDQEDKQDQNKDDQQQENQENKNEENENKDQEKQEEKEQEKQKEEEQNAENEEQQQEQNSEEEQSPEEQEKQAQQEELNEKLQEMNLTEEKAQMILEAMKNSEVQYLQQQKKKPKRAPNPNLPNW